MATLIKLMKKVTITTSGTAPETSPNTDGIHTEQSVGVNITNHAYKNGDDRVSLGNGSQQITVTKVTCGPSHGIRVGSCGKYLNEKLVVGVAPSPIR